MKGLARQTSISSHAHPNYSQITITLLSNMGREGRESSHGRKELFNLPPLVLKARAPNDGSAFCIGFSSRLEVPEQTLGGIPLGLGMVMKINFFEFSCTICRSNMYVHTRAKMLALMCIQIR